MMSTSKRKLVSEDDESQENENADEVLKKEPLVFLMSTLVGVLGLNLVSASRVVIIDPAKNPSTDNQTVDRAFRLGQLKNVIIYRLITCDTVEENTYRNQIVKGEIANSITEGRQCRRGIPMKTGRVLTLPRTGFSDSLTHKELVKTYKKEFDKEMAEEVRLVQESPVVSCITNHSILFSLEEDRYRPHEAVDNHWPGVKDKVSEGISTEHSSAVSGGHRDAAETYDSRWRDRRGSSAKHKGKSVQ